MSIRRYLAIVAGSVLAAAVVAVPSASASTNSTTVQGSQYANGAGLCLDGSISSGVTVKACKASSTYQRWTLDSEFNIFANEHYANECLDGSVSQGVRLATCNISSYYQNFYRSGAEFRNTANLDYCLDGSASQGVRMMPCNGSKYQQWSKLQNA